MIIESGVIIFLGFVFLAIKLPTRTVLRLLGKPFTLDLSASILAFLMHMGTFSGVMSAAVAGLMISGLSSGARYAVGWIDDNKYYPGRIWQLDVRKLR